VQAGAEPRIVGAYAIYGEIASGGMASVHFARLADPSGRRRTVAVKRAHPHLARETDFALMFLDEARLASRIQHANVVSTIDVVQANDDLLLAMDYIHGESLWKILRTVKDKGERVPARVAAAIVIDALHGLHAAHEATDERGGPLGLVHRDVSPQNILVGADGVTRLVDFGIAKAAGRLHSTRDSAVKGKYAYMAPEQVRGDPVSRLTDTYAAMIVFWELLTGERLFVGRTEAETIHKCLVGRVQSPSLFAPEISPRLDDIVKRGLSREPMRRYQTARDMALDIESCVSPAPPSEVAAWVGQVAGEALAARANVLAEIEQGEREAARAPWSVRKTWMLSLALVATLVAVGAVTFAAKRRVESVRGPEITTVDVPEPTALASEPAAPATAAALPAAQIAAPGTSATPVASPAPMMSAAPSPPIPTTRAAAPRRTSHPRRSACNPPYSIDAEGRQIFKPECM
jgi:serine/threonine-protein kinase